jgi:hypothetical protein
MRKGTILCFTHLYYWINVGGTPGSLLPRNNNENIEPAFIEHFLFAPPAHAK